MLGSTHPQERILSHEQICDEVVTLGVLESEAVTDYAFSDRSPHDFCLYLHGTVACLEDHGTELPRTTSTRSSTIIPPAPM